MFSTVRRHLNPATVLALLALVFAMTGGALAVNNHGTGGPSKRVSASASGARAGSGPAILAGTAKKSKSKAGARGPAGPRGAAGPAGVAGPAGPTGPTGAAGSQGPAGTAGTNGTNGTNGENVAVAEASSKECKEGGTKFSNASGAGKACNGKTGFTSTLPPEKTETGTWSATGIVPPGEPSAYYTGYAPISFSIPLAAPLVDEEQVCAEPGSHPMCKTHVIKDAEAAPSGCTGGTVEKPSAEPGNLCVYEGLPLGPQNKETPVVAFGIYNPALHETEGALPTGAVLYVIPAKNETAGDLAFKVIGTWAVTAPAAG
jgi:Collagen triple helix repeat (20 copies)